MKRLMILLIAMATGLTLFAQKLELGAESAIASYRLELAWHKTTMLIFPSPVKLGQRGDGPVLAEKAKDVENVLLVKAGQKNFPESNLQVITDDGKVYAFTVSYNEQPANTTFDLRKQKPIGPVTFTGGRLNEEQVRQLAHRITAIKPLYHKGGTRNGIGFHLAGIYIKDDLLFIRYHVRNFSAIGYDRASIRFFIRDRKRAKRTAEQDNESLPLLVHSAGLPEDGSGQTIVAVFPKFTIADNKFFIAQLMEAGGDRNAGHKISQQRLLRVFRLN